MRLWHYKLIPFLPKSQLLAQWRELNSIFKKQNKHILINYIYEYPKKDLAVYTYIVMDEIHKRGYKTNSANFVDNFIQNDANKYKWVVDFGFGYKPFENYHNFRYLQRCDELLEEK